MKNTLILLLLIFCTNISATAQSTDEFTCPTSEEVSGQDILTRLLAANCRKTVLEFELKGNHSRLIRMSTGIRDTRNLSREDVNSLREFVTQAIEDFENIIARQKKLITEINDLEELLI